ncbi:MAG: PaaX family transcriptional regulator C-terminal domain-containing protein [Salinisphaeraceae bacterium]|nr:PaaX family transcriptional regulator C-terminal domain-containing protein [Salinisphaeraceae bacterium]
MQPTAKKLILGLLLAREGQPLTVREAINACALFNITENNVRVTLVRLSGEGLIESHGRGAYVLGPAAITTASEVAHWHEAEARLQPWSGSYICVHTSTLGRSDRKALRRREWALNILGMRELERGLYLRPDNLAGGVDGVRQRLLSLGLEAAAAVFVATDFDRERRQHIEQLWDGSALNNLYNKETQRLERWMERCQELEADVAARESYLMGSKAIRQLVFDPWLPEPMIDAAARHHFLQTVQRFDECGKAIWAQLGAIDMAMPVAAAASPLTSGTLQ